MRNVKIEKTWYLKLKKQFSSHYMEDLSKFLGSEKKQGKIIYPPIDKIFRAFDLTSFNTVRVVILGQDPYHGQNQANGLSFSVELGIPTPPSLLNIYKELKNDLGIEPPNHGNLEHWAREGVLLLNTCLTVENGMANSHQGQGWEIFTDAVLSVINAEKLNTIFVLWGRKAQKKKKIIDISKHLIIESAHPSPLSAHNGFFGSRPFSKINSYLSTNNLPPVNWNFK